MSNVWRKKKGFWKATLLERGLYERPPKKHGLMQWERTAETLLSEK